MEWDRKAATGSDRKPSGGRKEGGRRRIRPAVQGKNASWAMKDERTPKTEKEEAYE